MSLALFGSSQSASFECQFKNRPWGTFGTIYYCDVQNSVSITSLHTADDISGTHLSGYNNDNVEAFNVERKGQIHHFPRGLNKIFKKLKGILITGSGLKEIHQSDLKDFPKLIFLSLSSNNLEILEENLFQFNLNLEVIYLDSNKISHIDPSVFEKLTKLKTLYLQSNSCINMYARNNPTAVQKIIRTAKAQCTNSNYSNLKRKVKNLEIDSRNSNSENFMQRNGKLENDVKFPNAFQQKLQNYKAAQFKKAREDTTTTTEFSKESESINFETCSALESKIDEIAVNLNYCVDQTVIGVNSDKIDNGFHQNEQCASIKEDLRNQTEAMDTRMEILEENVENFKISALREIQNIKNAVKDAHHGLMMSMNIKANKNEKQIKKIEEQIKEMNRKFEEKFAKLLKALKIDG